MSAQDDKPGTPGIKDELSMFIELRPKEVNDQTSMIDRKQLRSAKKEAAKVERIVRKTERSDPIAGVPVRSRSRSNFLMLMLVPVLGVAVTYVLLATRLMPTSVFGPLFEPYLEPFFSPVPTYADLDSESLQLLRAAVREPIGKEAPRVAAVLSRESNDKPIFYVASNMPDNTNFSFELIGQEGTLIPDRPTVVRFPITLSRHHAKTKPIVGADGHQIPIGEYTVRITEDEEQIPKVKEILDGIPGPSGAKKIIFSKTFFPRGKKDQKYVAELRTILDQLRQEARAEIASAQSEIFALQALLAETDGAWIKALRTRIKKKIRSDWAKFEGQWLVQAAAKRSPIRGSGQEAFFPELKNQLETARSKVQKLHEMQTNAVTTLKLTSASQAVNTSSAEARQEIEKIKARLFTLASESAAPDYRPPRKTPVR